MKKYISTIRLLGLWHTYDLTWNLGSGVNILAGGNGSGKSTLLRSLGELFTTGRLDTQQQRRVGELRVEFSDGRHVTSAQEFDPSEYDVQVISTFDATLKQSDAVFKLSEGTVSTYLDWELYKQQNRYLSYQLEVGRRVIEALGAGCSHADIALLTARKSQFFDILDSLFSATGKLVDRNSDTLSFKLGRSVTPVTIRPYDLSSGEKQVLLILTTVLLSHDRPMTIIMDEPEISLHFDWQRRLIEDICNLNGNLQLIIATHSPAMVMNGWTDRVSEIDELLMPADGAVRK